MFIQDTKNSERPRTVPFTVASNVLRHADSSMTRRYQRHEAAMSDAQVADIERALGLTG